MLHFSSIRWRIALPYTLLILTMMAGLAVYLSGRVYDERLASLETSLRSEARLMSASSDLRTVLTEQPAGAADLIARWRAAIGRPVEIVGVDGAYLGEPTDAEQSLAAPERPEMAAALDGSEGRDVRPESRSGAQTLYVAVPVMENGMVVGVVGTSLPLSEADAALADFRRGVVAATLVGMILAVGLALFIAERTASPVRRLTRLAERLAQGELDERLLADTTDEIGQLTETINYMAGQLREKVAQLDGERGRLAAVMDGMVDGLLIAGADGTVRMANPAASRMLGAGPVGPVGLSIVQALRDHRLVEVWQRAQRSGRLESGEVELEHRAVRVRLVVTPHTVEGEPGSLLIFQDLTQLRRLETVRRDFVSNVSHELRTPLAALKALVETLRDGALDDPPAARHFLDRMEGEVDALTKMVAELLELSSIESGRLPLKMAPVAVTELVKAPVERLRPLAEKAGVSLGVDVPEGLPVVDGDLDRLQQVVTNLVHNAVKFTASGGSVRVTARADGTERVVVAVEDTGAGIAPADLPRVFERFYKADRARSGGGAGLGLAIARHIVESHGGRIWAESRPGQGSRFSFSLPAADGKA